MEDQTFEKSNYMAPLPTSASLGSIGVEWTGMKTGFIFNYSQTTISAADTQTGGLSKSEKEAQTAAGAVPDADEEGRFSALRCYMLDQDGGVFELLIPYAPYFYVAPAEGYEREVELGLQSAFGPLLRGIQREEKEDLDLLNHLSGKRRTLIKVSFANTSDMTTVRQRLEAAIRRNRSATGAGAAAAERDGDNLDFTHRDMGSLFTDTSNLGGAMNGAPLHPFGAFNDDDEEDDDADAAAAMIAEQGGGIDHAGGGGTGGGGGGSNQAEDRLSWMRRLYDIREYDVRYFTRVAIDLNVYVGSWYDVTHLEGVSATSGNGVAFVEIDDPYTQNVVKFTCGNVEMSKRDDMAPIAPKACAFDIETTKQPLKFPVVERDEIYMLSYMVDGRGALITSRTFVTEDITGFDYTPKPEYPGDFSSIFNEPDEESLIRRFVKEMQEEKPQIYVTYNGDYFDWPFLMCRAQLYGIELGKELGGFSMNREGATVTNAIPHLDCLYWVNRDSYLPQGSRGLKAVTRAKLGFDPIEVDPEEMLPMAQSEPRRMAAYSVSDAVSTYYLFKKYIHPFIFSLCTIIPLAPDDVLRKGSGTLCEVLLMVQAYKKHVVFPNKMEQVRERFHNGHLIDSETYIGGRVEALKSGVFRSDIPLQFNINPPAIDFLAERLDDMLKFAIEVENDTPLSAVTNYDEVKSDILAKLMDLKQRPNRMEEPMIYHLDVGAMYPNIILTNRLQPPSMVTPEQCAACCFNSPDNSAKCKRTLPWMWKADLFTGGRHEYNRIKAQLESESFSTAAEEKADAGAIVKATYGNKKGNVLEGTAFEQKPDDSWKNKKKNGAGGGGNNNYRKGGGGGGGAGGYAADEKRREAVLAALKGDDDDDGKSGDDGDSDGEDDGDGTRKFRKLKENTQFSLIKKRFGEYSRKAYKKTHETKEILREHTVCQRENSFYVDTVRLFRDRRYEYKRELKRWKGLLEKALEAGDAAGIKEGKARCVQMESLQLAHKVVLNSFYGYVMRKGSRWYSMEMAGIVTYVGASLIMMARQLVQQLGVTLELDTDGIWCCLPKSFPEDFAFKTNKGKSFKISYPCVMLNKDTQDKFSNHQYQDLPDPRKFRDKETGKVTNPIDKKKLTEYVTRSECSIYFEVDGPYLAMILPASREEGKSIKKRYAVFDHDKTMTELKGFELKRRGELALIKDFQSQVFSQFLEGTSLTDAYAAAAAVANESLDMLYSQGENYDDEEVLAKLSENRSMSRRLCEYAHTQKSLALTTARRLAQWLGPEMVKDKGLSCRFCLSTKPAGKPRTERAIPLDIFKSEVSDAVRVHFLRQWTGDESITASRSSIKDILDWGYYIERFNACVQKIISIPAALQMIPNPVPRVQHPDWLNRLVRRRESEKIHKQLSLTSMFSNMAAKQQQMMQQQQQQLLLQQRQSGAPGVTDIEDFGGKSRGGVTTAIVGFRELEKERRNAARKAIADMSRKKKKAGGDSGGAGVLLMRDDPETGGLRRDDVDLITTIDDDDDDDADGQQRRADTEIDVDGTAGGDDNEHHQGGGEEEEDEDEVANAEVEENIVALQAAVKRHRARDDAFRRRYFPVPGRRLTAAEDIEGTKPDDSNVDGKTKKGEDDENGEEKEEDGTEEEPRVEQEEEQKQVAVVAEEEEQQQVLEGYGSVLDAQFFSNPSYKSWLRDAKDVWRLGSKRRRDHRRQQLAEERQAQRRRQQERLEQQQQQQQQKSADAGIDADYDVDDGQHNVVNVDADEEAEDDMTFAELARNERRRNNNKDTTATAATAASNNRNRNSHMNNNEMSGDISSMGLGLGLRSAEATRLAAVSGAWHILEIRASSSSSSYHNESSSSTALLLDDGARPVVTVFALLNGRALHTFRVFVDRPVLIDVLQDDADEAAPAGNASSEHHHASGGGVVGGSSSGGGGKHSFSSQGSALAFLHSLFYSPLPATSDATSSAAAEDAGPLSFARCGSSSCVVANDDEGEGGGGNAKPAPTSTVDLLSSWLTTSSALVTANHSHHQHPNPPKQTTKCVVTPWLLDRAIPRLIAPNTRVLPRRRAAIGSLVEVNVAFHEPRDGGDSYCRHLSLVSEDVAAVYDPGAGAVDRLITRVGCVCGVAGETLRARITSSSSSSRFLSAAINVDADADAASTNTNTNGFSFGGDGQLYDKYLLSHELEPHAHRESYLAEALAGGMMQGLNNKQASARPRILPALGGSGDGGGSRSSKLSLLGTGGRFTGSHVRGRDTGMALSSVFLFAMRPSSTQRGLVGAFFSGTAEAFVVGVLPPRAERPTSKLFSNDFVNNAAASAGLQYSSASNATASAQSNSASAQTTATTATNQNHTPTSWGHPLQLGLSPRPSAFSMNFAESFPEALRKLNAYLIERYSVPVLPDHPTSSPESNSSSSPLVASSVATRLHMVLLHSSLSIGGLIADGLTCLGSLACVQLGTQMAITEDTGLFTQMTWFRDVSHRMLQRYFAAPLWIAELLGLSREAGVPIGNLGRCGTGSDSGHSSTVGGGDVHVSAWDALYGRALRRHGHVRWRRADVPRTGNELPPLAPAAHPGGYVTWCVELNISQLNVVAVLFSQSITETDDPRGSTGLGTDGGIGSHFGILRGIVSEVYATAVRNSARETQKRSDVAAVGAGASASSTSTQLNAAANLLSHFPRWLRCVASDYYDSMLVSYIDGLATRALAALLVKITKLGGRIVSVDPERVVVGTGKATLSGALQFTEYLTTALHDSAMLRHLCPTPVQFWSSLLLRGTSHLVGSAISAAHATAFVTAKQQEYAALTEEQEQQQQQQQQTTPPPLLDCTLEDFIERDVHSVLTLQNQLRDPPTFLTVEDSGGGGAGAQSLLATEVLRTTLSQPLKRRILQLMYQFLQEAEAAKRAARYDVANDPTCTLATQHAKYLRVLSDKLKALITEHVQPQAIEDVNSIIDEGSLVERQVNAAAQLAAEHRRKVAQATGAGGGGGSAEHGDGDGGAGSGSTDERLVPHGVSHVAMALRYTSELSAMLEIVPGAATAVRSITNNCYRLCRISNFGAEAAAIEQQQAAVAKQSAGGGGDGSSRAYGMASCIINVRCPHCNFLSSVNTAVLPPLRSQQQSSHQQNGSSSNNRNRNLLNSGEVGGDVVTAGANGWHCGECHGSFHPEAVEAALITSAQAMFSRTLTDDMICLKCREVATTTMYSLCRTCGGDLVPRGAATASMAASRAATGSKTLVGGASNTSQEKSRHSAAVGLLALEAVAIRHQFVSLTECIGGLKFLLP